MKIGIEGFVVVGPISPWDEKHREAIISDMSFQSFGRTPAEAWRRHMGPWKVGDNEVVEFSRRVQFWFNRGYRIKQAKMEIYDDPSTDSSSESDD